MPFPSGNTEWNLDARGIADIFEVHEHALRPSQDAGKSWSRCPPRADEGLEHQVELASFGQLTFGEIARMFARLFQALGFFNLIGTKAQLTRLAVNHRVCEVLS